MREQLEEVQDFIDYITYMREALLKDGSVSPDEEESVITHIEAKKQVLKYLDFFAGALAGAHLRLSLWENDPIFTEPEKNEMTSKVIEDLGKEFDVLTPAIKDYYYCLGRHFRSESFQGGPSVEE